MAENLDRTVQEGEIYKMFMEKLTPTKEDLERVLTDAELTELCLKRKCRVDTWRWNPVNDFRRIYEEKGRYQRWSEKLRRRMLAHSVNLRKPGVLYDENEIAETRRKERDYEKKYNILSLAFWERERNKEKQCSSDYDNSVIDCSVPSLTVTDTETQIDDDNMDGLLNLTQNEENVLTKNPSDKKPINTQNEENIQNIEDRNSSSEKEPIKDMFQKLNTESLTISSSMFSTQSQQLSENVSENVFPLHDYDNFNNEIPLTSTQSQNPRSEEIVD